MSKLDELEEHLIKDPKRHRKENPLLEFFLGLLLLGLGVFLVFQYTTVRTVWYTWSVGSFGVPTGAVVVPMFIGIALLFYNSKSIISWIVTVIGLAFVLITILLSVKIVFQNVSLFVYVLIFGSVFAGVGLLLRALFRAPKK